MRHHYHFYGPESVEPIEDNFDWEAYTDEMIDQEWDDQVDREMQALERVNNE